MKKVLIITYYWPPAGGPGVQRILKFAKYLPEFGWQPIILTVTKGVYPALDPSLLSEVDPQLKIFQSKCPEPDYFYKKLTGSKKNSITPIALLAEQNINWKKRLAHNIRENYFIPDAKKFWRSFAVREGKKIIKKEKPDLIFSSSPPPTTHLIAHDLAKISSIPWVADFRDPWTKIHYYNKTRKKRAQLKDTKLEKMVLIQCNKATCVSRHFADLLEIDDNSKVDIVHNGFDALDFKESNAKSEKFKITYIGGLNPNRFYKSIFSSIKSMLDDKKIPRDKFELGFAGQIDNTIKKEIINLLEQYGVLKFYGYLEHQKAISLMKQSNLLLLFMEDKSNYQGHLPGKLFEYMASGTSILGIGMTNSEASKIVKQSNCGVIIDKQSDPTQFINQHFKDWQAGISFQSNQDFINQFERKQLTGKLADIFNALI